ncbi:PDDEXK family nuclease [Thermofilum pendens]|uniref:Holliday junction resolvase n=1 Tax=Thermofilum pendens (strain DSM 2475 / Hrk 5) TaxID=368408 RepID=A1RYI7_THEPD|nr:Holliday junction DNA helicase [Thermofilum pendens]ABL78267.1 holliday junction resolvase [Thermofilum pendens Hrk 5]
MSREVVSRRQKAFNVERRLVKMLSSNRENYVFRVPVSGVGENFPDVFLVNNVEDRVVAFEVKTTVNSKVKVKAHQVSKLFRFLEAFKKYKTREAVIAVWFSSEGKWVFRRVDGLFASDIVITSEDESDWKP